MLFQLRLMDSNPLEYQANIARYKEVFYYWFWSNLATGSYLMICLVALGGCALRLAFDRVSTARRLADMEDSPVALGAGNPEEPDQSAFHL